MNKLSLYLAWLLIALIVVYGGVVVLNPLVFWIGVSATVAKLIEGGWILFKAQIE
jgi:hypothetical protein